MYKFVCRNCGMHFKGSDDDYSFSTGSSGSSFDSFGGGFSDGGGCSGDW